MALCCGYLVEHRHMDHDKVALAAIAHKELPRDPKWGPAKPDVELSWDTRSHVPPSRSNNKFYGRQLFRTYTPANGKRPEGTYGQRKNQQAHVTDVRNYGSGGWDLRAGVSVGRMNDVLPKANREYFYRPLQIKSDGGWSKQPGHLLSAVGQPEFKSPSKRSPKNATRSPKNNASPTDKTTKFPPVSPNSQRQREEEVHQFPDSQPEPSS